MGAECRPGKVGLGWLGPDSAQRPGTQQARRALGPRSNRSSPPPHTHTHTRQNASPRREPQNADGKPARPFFPDLVN